MAKKNKTKAKSAPRSAPPMAEVPAEVDKGVTPAETAEPRVSRTPKLSRSQAAAERIEDEYSYITGDLRRVFILAGFIFGLLIVLNLVLGAAG